MAEQPVPPAVDEALLLRLLRLEQRIEAYERLHAEELREIRAEIERLKRTVIGRGLTPHKPDE